MDYKYITEHDSPNFGYPVGTRGQNEPKQIVIHHWGSDDSTFGGVVSWLCDPSSQVSAHFVVEAGRSACLVNWNDAGWHAGNKDANMSSIGIECHPRCSYADMVEVAKVIAMLWTEYGKLPLVGHKDVVATACPGRWYDKLEKLAGMAEIIYDGGELPEGAQNGEDEANTDKVSVLLPVLRRGDEGENVKALQALLKGYGHNIGIWGVDGKFGSGTEKGVKQFQKENGLEVDGIVGKETWTKLLGVAQVAMSQLDAQLRKAEIMKE